MNAAFATFWAGMLDEPRFTIPYVALGYKERAGKLLAVLDEVPVDASGDRALVERWSGLIGLADAFHFNLMTSD